MSGSEIAQFRERQSREAKAAQRALEGLAVVASHEAIIARMEQGAEAILPLFQQGRNDEAFALWYAGVMEVQP